jgi:hypothetical protein
MSQNLRDALRTLIESAMPSHLARKTPRLHMRGAGPSLAEQITDDLVQQAIRSGLPLRSFAVKSKELSGGGAAQYVAEVILHAPFVFKLDNEVPKLVQEAHMMRRIRDNPRLSDAFKRAWPIIYAIRDQAPYAYIMEYFPHQDGWMSLEDRLFPADVQLPASPVEVARCLNAVLDVVFLGYQEGKTTRFRSNLFEDYVGRISERLSAAADANPLFAPRHLCINGQNFEPWEIYVEQLNSNRGFIEAITPPFTTIVHGDLNPGNVMLRLSLSGVEVKLIDPKEWETGDYLYDIAKLTEFMLATGPIEKPASLIPIESDVTKLDTLAEVTYRFDVPRWANDVVAVCLDRVRRFGVDNHDEHWEARYELAMASNLLGLPAGRLGKGRLDAAVALYGEGLRWLSKFCSRLPKASV